MPHVFTRINMVIIRKIQPLRNYLAKLHTEGNVGFVPTMGALHEGHLGLVRTSLAENRLTVASIFVNPAQFNDPSDYEKYPITVENDIRLLETEGCDLLFLPSVEEIYPDGTPADEWYDLGSLDREMEGRFRPGHFQGVCKVVSRLLDAVEPDRLYLGQKDYQQCMVISRLLQLKNMSATLRICATRREADGLAMSSRNVRLSGPARSTAPLIHTMLQYARSTIRAGDLGPLKKHILSTLQSGGFKPEYFEFANANDLSLRSEWDGREPLVALVAAYLDGVRLIDNMTLT